ncbi:mucin-19-like isoform X2 [Diabrotica virgifera virgifera]|uniref:Mucin-19-like n=1 Tax=Diabrotica virgifera virgifera TaxID=50390 RepID=A0A6P7GZ31_DIAVI|nr:mucin-19-like isoform X2 [Diabrotica virgifera virgifera]
MKNTLALCILVTISVLVFAVPKCPENSHQGCRPCCPNPSCRFRNPTCPKDRVCTFDCKFACICDKGYIWDDIGIVGGCIRPKDCPPIKY